MSTFVRPFAYIQKSPLTPTPHPVPSGPMSTTQTPPPPAGGTRPATNPVPALPAPHQALLADFDDPDLTELDLARRHALTLDGLAAIAAAPAFARALALLRALREVRRPLQRARAEARAAETLTALAARTPTSATAAKEARLAVKDLLNLLGEDGLGAEGLGAGSFQPSGITPAPAAFKATSSPPCGTDFQSASSTSSAEAGDNDPTPHAPTPSAPTPPLDAPTPRPARKPRYPRGTKPRPKPRSR